MMDNKSYEDESVPLLKNPHQKKRCILEDKSYFSYIRGLIIGSMALGAGLFLIEPILILFMLAGLLIPISYYYNKVYRISEDNRLIVKNKNEFSEIPYKNIEVVEGKVLANPGNFFKKIGIVIIVLAVLGIASVILLEVHDIGFFVSSILYLITGITSVYLGKPISKNLHITRKANAGFQTQSDGSSFKVSSLISFGLLIFGIFHILIFIQHLTGGFVGPLFESLYNLTLFPIFYSIFHDTFMVIIAGLVTGFVLTRVGLNLRGGASGSSESVKIPIVSIRNISKKNNIRRVFNLLKGTNIQQTNRVETYIIKKMRTISLIGVLLGGFLVNGLLSGGRIDPIYLLIYIAPPIFLTFILFRTDVEWTAKVNSKSFTIEKKSKNPAPQTNTRSYCFHNMSSLKIKRFINKGNLAKGFLLLSISLFLLGTGFLPRMISSTSIIIITGFAVPYFYGAKPQWRVSFRGRSGKSDYALNIKNKIAIQDLDFVKKLNQAYTKSITGPPIYTEPTKKKLPKKRFTKKKKLPKKRFTKKKKEEEEEEEEEEFIYCPYCGKEIKRNSHYCTHCGESLEK